MRTSRRPLPLLLLLVLSCDAASPAPGTKEPVGAGEGSGSADGSDGSGNDGGDGSGADGAVDAPLEALPEAVDDGCPTLFAQGRLPAFELEITDTDWAALEADYASGVKQYHPAVFRYVDDGGTLIERSDAAVRLKGNPGFSWIGEKMQFVISMNESDPDGRFMGLRKIALDSSWYDPSILRDRLSYALLRRMGIEAPCANNATLSVNGAFYGLYANIEFPDQEYLDRIYGDEGATGTLWKYGSVATVNEEASDGTAISAFWANSGVAWQEANTDLEANIREWAGEATLPQNDGYWCCNHNYYLYEHPSRGIVFQPWDMDFSFDDAPYFADPYTFYRDSGYQPHFDAVVADPVYGPRFVAAMAAAVEAYDPDWIAEQVSTWEAQIAEPFSRDRLSTHTVGAQSDAADRLVSYARNRQAYLHAWVTCHSDGGDEDGDGFEACGDCDDRDPAIHPGAADLCNERDDDCNGRVDDGEACADCDEYSFEDSRMLFCPSPGTFEESVARCAAYGAELGFPMGTYDWYVFWLHNYWQDYAWTGGAWWWVGATDTAAEGAWLTPSGAPVGGWAAWGGGAPNGGVAENCAGAAPGGWYWDDQDCGLRLPAVCRL
jgi:hypothetical protein